MSEQLTAMVLAGLKNNTHKPQPLVPPGFPKKKRPSTSSNGTMKRKKQMILVDTDPEYSEESDVLLLTDVLQTSESEEEPQRPPKRRRRKQENKTPKKKKTPERKKIRGKTTSTQRCSFSAFFQLVSHVQGIPDKAWHRLERTPFWPIIDLAYNSVLTMYDVIKHESDLNTLLGCYDTTTQEFVFGNRRMKLQVADVASLFAMKAEGEKIDTSKERPKKVTTNSTIKRYFKGVSEGVTKGHVREQIEDACKKYKELKPKKGNKEMLEKLEDEIAQLILMHLFSSFLFIENSTYMRWDLTLCCTDFDSLWKYNWPETILSHLRGGLSNVKPGKWSSIKGCVMLILYCFCKKFRKNFVAGRDGSEADLARYSLQSHLFKGKVLNGQQVEQILIEDEERQPLNGQQVEQILIEDEERQPQDDGVQYIENYEHWEPAQSSQELRASQEYARQEITDTILDMENMLHCQPTQKQWENALRKIDKLKQYTTVQIQVIDTLFEQIDERDDVIEKMKRVSRAKRLSKIGRTVDQAVGQRMRNVNVPQDAKDDEDGVGVNEGDQMEVDKEDEQNVNKEVRQEESDEEEETRDDDKEDEDQESQSDGDNDDGSRLNENDKSGGVEGEENSQEDEQRYDNNNKLGGADKAEKRGDDNGRGDQYNDKSGGGDEAENRGEDAGRDDKNAAVNGYSNRLPAEEALLLKLVEDIWGESSTEDV